MSEILVPRAIDRSKYVGRMLYIDKQGNICAASRNAGLTIEEKAKREIARRSKRAEEQAQRMLIRDRFFVAKREARKNPTVENAKALEKAKLDYEASRK